MRKTEASEDQSDGSSSIMSKKNPLFDDLSTFMGRLTVLNGLILNLSAHLKSAQQAWQAHFDKGLDKDVLKSGAALYLKDFTDQNSSGYYELNRPGNPGDSVS